MTASDLHNRAVPHFRSHFTCSQICICVRLNVKFVKYITYRAVEPAFTGKCAQFDETNYAYAPMGAPYRVTSILYKSEFEGKGF
jgi:hypothetical protein